MERVDALVEALEAQHRIGQQVQPAGLSLDTCCRGWTVRDVMNHSIGVTSKFTDFATGLTDHPRTPRGDLIGRNHRSALRSSADAAQAAWASADMTRSCQLPFGTFAADMAAGINLFDVLAHTWDIATVTGLCIECTDDVWSDGLHAAQMVIGPNRDLRYYGPEIVPSRSASPMERLLAFLGRSHATCP